jgi:hypothetical protein
MAIDFDYDLDETVSSGTQHFSLRTAVRQYIEARKRAPAGHVLAPMWNRDGGKVPSHFEASHLTALAQLPKFRKD